MFVWSKIMSTSLNSQLTEVFYHYSFIHSFLFFIYLFIYLQQGGKGDDGFPGEDGPKVKQKQRTACENIIQISTFYFFSLGTPWTIWRCWTCWNERS